MAGARSIEPGAVEASAPQRVGYTSYGSNTHLGRLASLHFATEYAVWGGGRAFCDPQQEGGLRPRSSRFGVTVRGLRR